MQPDFSDTIVALATPPGRSGVAVIRLSGPHVREALTALGVRPLPEPRQAALRGLKHPVSGELLDRGLILFFQGPYSFTGEDVAELQVHGSRAVLSELLDALTGLDGLRLAEPGEFARRAFHYHKADLTELEGLADLIEAETTAQRRQAQRLMEGQLTVRCEALRQSLLHTLAYIEAYLDFPDEEIPEHALTDMHRELQASQREVEALLSGSRQAEIVRDGFRVSLAGIPNAGKSSLLNALLQRDAAIVTDIPGTTRDVLEARLSLRGYLVILCDTAGIRDSSDPVEQQGILRARASLEAADLRIWLLDPTQPLAAQMTLIAGAQPGDLVVFTKADLVTAPQVDFPEGVATLNVSSVSSAGLNHLLDAVHSRIVSALPVEAALLTRQRQVTAFDKARQHLVAAQSLQDLVLKAEEVRLCIRSLAFVIGVVDVDNILDIVFGSFCIGK